MAPDLRESGAPRGRASYRIAKVFGSRAFVCRFGGLVLPQVILLCHGRGNFRLLGERTSREAGRGSGRRVRDGRVENPGNGERVLASFTQRDFLGVGDSLVRVGRFAAKCKRVCVRVLFETRQTECSPSR